MSDRFSANDWYRLARDLLPEMREPMRSQVVELLRQAEAGRKTDKEIAELIATDPELMIMARDLATMGEGMLRGLDDSALGGDVPSPEARKFICPVPDHDYVVRIQSAGEDPGLCPVHMVALIPYDQKKGGRK